MKRRYRFLTAALIVPLLIVPLEGGSSAIAENQPPPEALDVTRSYEHVGSAEEASRIERLRLESGSKGEALYQVAEQRPFVVQTPASEVDETLVIDPITFDECRTGHPNPGTEPFWFQDKYNACYSSGIEIKYFAVSDGKHVGSSFFRVEFIGVAQDRSNQIRFGVRLIHSHDERETHKSETDVKLSLGCINRDAPNRDSVCAHDDSVERKVQQWQDDAGANPVWFTATTTTTRVPADKYKAEMRGFFNFDLRVTTTGKVGLPTDILTPTESFRCDEATYVYGSKCVFDRVVSSLSFDLNDPTYKESAQFIKDAQTDIKLTKPGVSDKKVPGKLGENAPMHRLYSGYDAGKKIDGSRRKIRRACRKFFTVNYTAGPGGTRRQCDEYPFATTYENASLVDENTKWTYAVRAITGSHNEIAGNIYGVWLGQDHILDGDPFYVIVR